MRRLFALAALTGVLLVVLMASSASAAQPVINDHFHFTTTPIVSDFCGVPGTEVDTVVEHYAQDASGNFIDNVHASEFFTATATGKTIVASDSATIRTSGPIDNGDGTFSFVTSETGLLVHFQILNGPILKSASGEPIRSAGVLTITDIFDAATGNYITTTVTFTGPHLLAEGVDICGPAVDYLMDP